jgi:hypothetical protein
MDKMEVGEVSVLGRVHAHWSYPDAVLEGDITNLEGCEKCWWVFRESGSCWRGLDWREVGSVGCWFVSGYSDGAHCDHGCLYSLE